MNLRLNLSQNQPSSMMDQLATGFNDINLGRKGAPHLAQDPVTSRLAPHLDRDPVTSRPTLVIRQQNVSRICSPSEGHYARNPDRKINFKEPKIRENICFGGDAKLLGQFLLDIYDVMGQHASEFSSDKRRINWIASHFTSTTFD